MNKELKRWPVRKDETLQAFDAADELLLEELRERELRGKRILIANDSFGAISSNLKEFNVTSYTDSFVSFRAQVMNSRSVIVPESELSKLKGPFDLVILRTPKNLSFFEDLLCHLSQEVREGTPFIAASMVKHLAPGHFDLLQKFVGVTTTSLAKKKARLVFAKFEREAVASSWPAMKELDGFKEQFLHHSNLFSREKLDVGTRFFLEHLPKGPFRQILDLGCANGVVGIKAKLLNPEAQVLFSDESKMAILSAKENYRTFFNDEAQFFWANCFEDQEEAQLDLVLCNPPFHQQQTVGDFIAWQMFKDSHRSLRKGGLLRIIGNSHLGYQHKLKKIFGNSKIVATNQKFMIVDAVK